jgi:bifunctional DNase/RNase
MAKDLVEVHIQGVAVDGGEGMPVVLLVDAEGRAALALTVGPFEASAIIIELEGIAPPRPLTHDLLAELFKEGGLSLLRAELFDDSGGGPRARLIYRRGLQRRTREVRPSDAVALAVRLRSPICVQRDILVDRRLAERSIAELIPDPETFIPRTSPRAV